MAVPPTISASDSRTAFLDEAVSSDEAVSWSVHLLKHNPHRLPQIGLVLLGAFAAGLAVFHSVWLALPPALALLFSASEYIFPVHYTLTGQSASARHGLTSLEIRWTDVRHAYLTDGGIKLSPLRAKNSRFEPLRGVYLRFDDTNREAVVEAVRRLRSHSPAETKLHG